MWFIYFSLSISFLSSNPSNTPRVNGCSHWPAFPNRPQPMYFTSRFVPLMFSLTPYMAVLIMFNASAALLGEDVRIRVTNSKCTITVQNIDLCVLITSMCLRNGISTCMRIGEKRQGTLHVCLTRQALYITHLDDTEHKMHGLAWLTFLSFLIQWLSLFLSLLLWLTL